METQQNQGKSNYRAASLQKVSVSSSCVPLFLCFVEMTFVRRATHAGPEGTGWYPSDAQSLTRLVGDWFSNIRPFSETVEATVLQNLRGGRRLVGVVGPHAGIRFSGPTASAAYRYVRDYFGTTSGQRVRRIFLLGPSHRKYIEGVEVSQAAEYETPNGSLLVDVDALRQLQSALADRKVPCRVMSRSTDEDEHSLELHLPFVSHALVDQQKSLLPHIKVVPILVGQTSNSQRGALAEVLAPYLASSDNFFVVSSDFCHWGQRFRYQYHYQPKEYPHIADAVIAMDHEAMRLLQARDEQGFQRYLDVTQNTICGQNPIAAVLRTMSHVEASSEKSHHFDLQFVHYSQSSRLKSSDDSSVSYASALFWS